MSKINEYPCNYCGKPVVEEEEWNKLEPNQQKNFRLEHKWSLNGMTINHDCFIRCKSNKGGKDCGKLWKLTKDNYPLVMFKHLSFFEDSSCTDCRLEEMEKQIEEWKKEGKVPNEETKEWYQQLRKISRKDSDNPQEREREREQKDWETTKENWGIGSHCQ